MLQVQVPVLATQGVVGTFVLLEHPPTYSTCIYTKICRYEHNDVQHWFGRTIIFLRAVRYSTRNTCAQVRYACNNNHNKKQQGSKTLHTKTPTKTKMKEGKELMRQSCFAATMPPVSELPNHKYECI